MAERTSPRPRHLPGHVYWYLDQVITVLAERVPDLAEAETGDITRSALVLTHFEHNYIT